MCLLMSDCESGMVHDGSIDGRRGVESSRRGNPAWGVRAVGLWAVGRSDIIRGVGK